MVLYGTIHRVGDAVTTEQIIAPAHRADDPAILAAHCLAAIDPALAEQVREGDVLVAGHGFGAGADADSAVLALQALGVAAIVCVDAADSFIEAANVYGLPVLPMPNAVAALPAGGIVRLDLARGTITDRGSGSMFHTPPVAPDVLAAAHRSQLLARMRRVVEEEGYDG